MEKNSIAEIIKDPENFDTSLDVPCKGPDCPIMSPPCVYVGVSLYRWVEYTRTIKRLFN
jgi:hypothetical protein